MLDKLPLQFVLLWCCVAGLKGGEAAQCVQEPQSTQSDCQIFRVSSNGNNMCTLKTYTGLPHGSHSLLYLNPDRSKTFQIRVSVINWSTHFFNTINTNTINPSTWNEIKLVVEFWAFSKYYYLDVNGRRFEKYIRKNRGPTAVVKVELQGVILYSFCEPATVPPATTTDTITTTGTITTTDTINTNDTADNITTPVRVEVIITVIILVMLVIVAVVVVLVRRKRRLAQVKHAENSVCRPSTSCPSPGNNLHPEKFCDEVGHLCLVENNIYGEVRLEAADRNGESGVRWSRRGSAHDSENSIYVSWTGEDHVHEAIDPCPSNENTSQDHVYENQEEMRPVAGDNTRGPEVNWSRRGSAHDSENSIYVPWDGTVPAGP